MSPRTPRGSTVDTVPDEAALPARRRGGWLPAGLLAMATTVLLVALLVASDPLLHATGLRTTGGVPTLDPTVFAPPTPTPLPTATGSGLVGEPAGVSPSASVVPGRLSAAVKAVPVRHGGTTAVLVLDAATGAPLHQQNQASLMVPASNMKTLVSLAALEALDPDHTFTTTTVLAPGNTVVLRGGGDPYLTAAATPALPGAPTLADLASRTAAALTAQGVASVRLAADDRLFTGPSWNPAWPQTYRDQVTPVSALMVDGGRVLDAQGRVVPGRPRPADATVDALTRFRALLTARGITVTGTPGRASATGAPLASVESLPLEVLVTQMMVHSDNTAAEVLLRQVALATGRPGSFAGGAQALQATLAGLGLWQQGAVVQDGSGLSRGNRVSAAMLAGAWLRISTTEQVSGLLVATPVAGVTGTLRDRFFTAEAAAGRGWVHAKTGTLREVSSLSGWTVTRDGQPVVLVLMVNGSTNDWFARVWIDQVAATVTACGCR